MLLRLWTVTKPFPLTPQYPLHLQNQEWSQLHPLIYYSATRRLSFSLILLWMKLMAINRLNFTFKAFHPFTSATRLLHELHSSARSSGHSWGWPSLVTAWLQAKKVYNTTRKWICLAVRCVCFHCDRPTLPQKQENEILHHQEMSVWLLGLFLSLWQGEGVQKHQADLEATR